MNATPKDSPLVIEFLSAFSMMRDACDDDAMGMIEQALADESFAKICERLYLAYDDLIAHEAEMSEKNIKFVGREFIKARRLFETKFHKSTLFSAGAWGSEETKVVAQMTAEMVKKMGKSFDDYARGFSKKVTEDISWDDADTEAKLIDKNIAEAVEFLKDVHDFGELLEEYYDDGYIKIGITDGIEKLFLLTSGIGPDSRGLFRRRSLTPLTLVPSRVSHSSFNPAKISMLSLLEEAQQAFIYGTPFASLTLLRAIVEIIFRDHYKVEGKDLADRINKGSSFLPKGVYPNDLHLLRLEANSLLHDRGAIQTINKINNTGDLEKKISSHLNIIRLMIENL